jgi:hypothetical protein
MLNTPLAQEVLVETLELPHSQQMLARLEHLPCELSNTSHTHQTHLQALAQMVALQHTQSLAQALSMLELQARLGLE